MNEPQPLNSFDLLSAGINGKPIPPLRALATFADTRNWAQIYGGEARLRNYDAKACEWAFIGPVRPPYELAQNALNTINAFFLDRDDDGHWHLVEASKRKEWDEWLGSGGEVTPSFAKMLGGNPNTIEFVPIK